ncbi:hypothetical protein IAR55_001988 [Kwoniella newhampshirensis]|uniref:Uncharacterized protein n=1 Tax=Kwoniella newhampshirensis TaxID=1651941 RepID=A0AAW0Z3N6_9TREE
MSKQISVETPSLLYHSSEPHLYPTNDPSISLLVIRFNTPVRIDSVRITPEGVRSISGPGVTYPPSFTGQILLNISPSNPVNAMASTEIVVEGCEHASDYEIMMPVGVTTRMMMLRSPAERLTISVYGFTDKSTNGTTVTDTADSSDVNPTSNEDWSWLWAWAGKDYNALLHLLNGSTPRRISQRAQDSLDLLLDTSNDPQTIYSSIISHPTALPFLISLPSQSAQPVLRHLLDQPEYALSPALRDHIPLDHPLRPLIQPSSSAQHTAAWRHLHLGRAALIALDGCNEEELLRVERREERSNLVRLVAVAKRSAEKMDKESTRCLSMVLSLLDPPPTSSLALNYLAKVLPPLTVMANVRGESRRLSLPLSHAQQVVTSLLSVSTEIIDGKSALSTAMSLAQPYLPQLQASDPLRLSFSPTLPTISKNSTHSADTADDRRLSRLAHAVDTASQSSDAPQSSLQHVISPAELLSLVAPSLVKSLSTASIPPFEITPSTSYASPAESQGASARAWAGKVYSSHEFRTRDQGPSVGLGIAGLGSGHSIAVAANLGVVMGGVSASGGGGGSRPASRHVDEYGTRRA